MDFVTNKASPEDSWNHHTDQCCWNSYHDHGSQIHTKCICHKYGSCRRWDKRISTCQTWKKWDCIIQCRFFGLFCNTEYQRNQYHNTSLKEYRCTNDKSCESKCPSGFLLTEFTNQSLRYSLGTSTYFQNSTKHGTQSYQKCDSLQCLSNTFFYRVWDHRKRHSSSCSDDDGRNHHWQNRVKLKFDDQYQQDYNSYRSSDHQSHRIRRKSCFFHFSFNLLDSSDVLRFSREFIWPILLFFMLFFDILGIFPRIHLMYLSYILFSKNAILEFYLKFCIYFCAF